MINYNEKLSQEQMLICESEKNLLVKACPGSGKTRTIVYKLAYRIEKNRKRQILRLPLNLTPLL